MKIICFGDSLTFGYQVSREEKWHVIAEKKTGIQLLNRGVSGETTDAMLKRFEQQVLAVKPDGMILMAGYNDIFFNQSWEQAAQNMITMVKKSRLDHIPVVVAIPPPIHLPVTFKEGGTVDFEKSAVMIEDYCRWLREYTALAEIPTLDFRATVDWTDKDLFQDGIHQSPAGHQRMAERVIIFLKNNHF